MENDVQAPPLTKRIREWEIEEIVGKEKRGKSYRVCVKWAYFEGLTWELQRNFLNTEALVAFEAEHSKLHPELFPYRTQTG